MITIPRGESLIIGLDGGTDVEVATVTALVANMKRSANGVPTGTAIPLMVTPRPAAGAIPAGWTLTLADTSALAVASYLLESKATVGGASFVHGPLIVRVRESVNG